MGSTLQEQFLKMGLVDKKQAEKVRKAQHQQKTGQSGRQELNESKTMARQALTEKKERSRLLNKKQNQRAREHESATWIRQLIEGNQISIQEGEITYNFTDNNKIKRLYLTEGMAQQLSNGTIAIVRQAGEYRIVPTDVAEKVRKFNKKMIVVFHPQDKKIPAADDPYAEYPVPDDLIW